MATLTNSSDVGNTGNMELQAVFIKQEFHYEDENGEIIDNDLVLKEEPSSIDNLNSQSQYKNNLNTYNIINRKIPCSNTDSTISSGMIATINDEVEIMGNDLCDSATDRKSTCKTDLAVVTAKIGRRTSCKTAFSLPDNLNKHLAISLTSPNGKSYYQCQPCKMEFSKSSYLKRHLLRHADMKPYQCQHCKKEFSQFRYLKRHLITHTNVKPYQCQHCKMEFSQYDYLKRHLRTHTVVKPSLCQVCSKKFSNGIEFSPSCGSSSGILHGMEKYQCHRCKKEFYNDSNFNDTKLSHNIV